MNECPKVVREWVETITYDSAMFRERQIRLALHPRPRWLPNRLWLRVIARLLVIEETQTVLPPDSTGGGDGENS